MTTQKKGLRDSLSPAGGEVAGSLCGAQASVPLKEAWGGTSLAGRLADLSGRSVLLLTRDPLAAALAMLELDGLAHRMVQLHA